MCSVLKRAFIFPCCVLKNYWIPKKSPKKLALVSSVFLDSNGKGLTADSKLPSELEQFEPAILQPLADDEIVDLLLELARRYPRVFKYEGLGPLNWFYVTDAAITSFFLLSFFATTVYLYSSADHHAQTFQRKPNTFKVFLR